VCEDGLASNDVRFIQIFVKVGQVFQKTTQIKTNSIFAVQKTLNIAVGSQVERNTHPQIHTHTHARTRATGSRLKFQVIKICSVMFSLDVI